MKGIKNRRFNRLTSVFIAFLLLAVFLWMERSGIRYQSQKHVEAYLPVQNISHEKNWDEEIVCILLVNSKEKTSFMAQKQLEQILTDMRVGYDICDVAIEPFPDLSFYQTAIVAVSNLNIFEESILTLSDWVSAGGRAMFALVLEKTLGFDMIANKIGIIESGHENTVVESFLLEDGFMVGGNQTFTITDPYKSSLTAQVSENCELYAWSAEGKIPLIWSHDYGDGMFAVNNMGFCEKAYRGFYAATYSLLEDVCVYPVINGSAFYIDDFPAPVPEGDGTYIRRDYQMTIGDFYTNIWWPDMRQIAEKYHMLYTGMLIENYEDKTSGELVRNTDVSRYSFFGNMLLDMGGELGFHGYNHQPLCLKESGESTGSGYHAWENETKMQESIEELTEFAQGIFLNEQFSVYVPPSNILSKEGRAMLQSNFPNLRTIASIYFPGESAYEQEFEVAEDGIVETPRIISGCRINDYMQIAALSELNMHFINSHFLHPDDLLDKNRGADAGWMKLKAEWQGYLDWLYKAAPTIRNMTGSQIAGAVERYNDLSLWKMDTPDDFYLTVDGLYDDAYFFVRVNKGELGDVTGGDLTHLTGNLYLLHVEKPEVVIKRSR
ncbi:MAG: DUF2194 domain-containing protein [Clostridium sp.]